jgi:hypothetical protein
MLLSMCLGSTAAHADLLTTAVRGWTRNANINAYSGVGDIGITNENRVDRSFDHYTWGYGSGRISDFSATGAAQVSHVGAFASIQCSSSMSVSGDTIYLSVRSGGQASVPSVDPRLGQSISARTGGDGNLGPQASAAFAIDFTEPVRWSVVGFSMSGGPGPVGSGITSGRELGVSFGSDNTSYWARSVYVNGDAQDTRSYYNGAINGYYAGTNYSANVPSLPGLSGTGSYLAMDLSANVGVLSAGTLYPSGAGTAVSDAIDIDLAVRISPVPAPGALSALAATGFFACRRRR